MNLKLAFRIFGGLNMLTGAFALFATGAFAESAGLTATSELETVGQAFGITTFAIGLAGWRTADLAGDALPAFGQLFGIIQALFIVLIGYHIMTGQAGGPPAYVNLVIGVVLAALFFMYSKK